MSHPIRDAKVQADVESKGRLLESFSAGKLTVEFHLKDGVWTLGGVSVTFPRKHGSTE